MPRIITITNQKGGVGKSTLALNLYACFKELNMPTALVDADPQGSLHDFARLSALELLEPPEDLAQLATLDDYKFILVDTPPYLSSQVPALVSISDLVLVPCGVGVPDALAIEHTLELIRAHLSDDGQAAIVLNRGRYATRSFVQELRKTLSRYPEPVLGTMVTERIAYGRSAMHGGVFNDTDEKAQMEIRALMGEVLSLIA